MSESPLTPEFIAALAQIDDDLKDYVRTLTHAEALSCIDHLGKLLYRSATYGPVYGTTDRAFRQRVPMVASALTLLSARAARTRPVRPGGRAAYNHDDCSAFHHLADLLQKLEDRLTVTLDGAGVKRL